MSAPTRPHPTQPVSRLDPFSGMRPNRAPSSWWWRPTRTGRPEGSDSPSPPAEIDPEQPWFTFHVHAGEVFDAGPLEPDTYSVSETVPEGWELTSVACDTNLLPGGTIVPEAIDLHWGETVTCTYRNRGLPGHIVIDTVTDPPGDATLLDFAVTQGSTPIAQLQLADASPPRESADLPPGTYAVTQTLPNDDWEWESTTCMSSLGHAESADSINLHYGETVTCAFNNTNTRPDDDAESFAGITVDVVTKPSGVTNRFGVSIEESGTSEAVPVAAGVLMEDQSEAYRSGPLAPGDYSIKASADEGWVTSIECTSSRGDVEPASDLRLDPGRADHVVPSTPWHAGSQLPHSARRTPGRSWSGSASRSHPRASPSATATVTAVEWECPWAVPPTRSTTQGSATRSREPATPASARSAGRTAHPVSRISGSAARSRAPTGVAPAMRGSSGTG